MGKNTFFLTALGRLISATGPAIGFSIMVGLSLLVKPVSAEIVDRVVAVVNDDIVSLYELEKASKPYVEQIRSSQYPPDVEQRLMGEVRQKILNDLIDEKLTDQELKRHRITTADQEVDNAIKRMAKDQYLTDEQLKTALEQQGMTMEEYRDEIKQQILRAKLVSREVRSKVVITQEDINAYYQQHLDEYAGEKKYRLRNVYIQVPSSAMDDERLRARDAMESILSDLEAGKPFEVPEVNFSSFSAPKVEGGELGLFKLDELAPKLQDALNAKKAGEFTNIIESDFGYQIVYIEDIIDVAGKTLEEATPEIQTKLYNEVVNRKFQSWLKVLRERSHVKIID